MSKPLLKSTATVGSMTLASRVTGLVRDVVWASMLGSGPVADAFLTAFRIPNFFRRIFGEGAFAVAFVPVLSDFKANRTAAETQRFIDRMAGRLAAMLLLLSVVGVVGAPWVVAAFAPGFKLDDPHRYAMTVDCLRIVFPYVFFISLVAMAGSILNTWRRFAVPAATPVLLNICLILAALVLTRFTENDAIALSIGVLIAGFVQLAVQIPFLKRDALLPIPRLGLKREDGDGTEGVGRVLKLMVPAVIGSSTAQINILINTQIATFLIPGSVSWLYYSDRLMEFPLGVFGIALATALLPTLSSFHLDKDTQRYSGTLDWALRWTVLIGLPASVGLVILATPMVSTLYFRGEFQPQDVEMTSRSLVAFAVGLVALVAVKVLAPGFYARENTKTPVRIAMVSVAVNILVSLLLFRSLGHVGLAVATSVSALVNASLLLWRLIQADIFHFRSGWSGFSARVIVASVLMGIAIYWLAGSGDVWLEMTTLARIAKLALCIAVGIVVYFSVILATGLRPRALMSPPEM